MKAGNSPAITSVPTTQRIPPETIEKRRLVSDATTPASRFPRAGVEATWANSIPETRPRMRSGVTLKRIVWRMTALTLSAAPAPARRRSASQSESANPNATMKTPQSPAAIATTRPCRRTCPIQPDSSDASSAPAYGAA